MRLRIIPNWNRSKLSPHQKNWPVAAAVEMPLKYIDQKIKQVFNIKKKYRPKN